MQTATRPEGPRHRRTHTLRGVQAPADRARTDRITTQTSLRKTAGRDVQHRFLRGRCSFGGRAPVGSAGPRQLRQTGTGKKAEDRGFTDDHRTGSPGKPASAGVIERAPTNDAQDASVSARRVLRHIGNRVGRTVNARREQALDGRSPRKHRATIRRKRRAVVTDLTVEQSPEVE
jgi:hypothetical protein